MLPVTLILFLACVLLFVHFAHGIQQQVGGRAQHGALCRGGSVHKFVNAFLRALAGLNDFLHRFIAKERVAFRVHDFAGLEENNPIRIGGIDVQRPGLPRRTQHLNHARADRDAKGFRSNRCRR